MAGLRIEGLRKGFGPVEILKGIDLDIRDGEFVCFLGPSGCGKSTLLRCIAGLETLSDGEIRLGERDITDAPSAKRDIAMVFQNYALYPHMTVAKNMSFGLSLNGMKRPEIEARVQEAAEILRIGELLHRKPKQLSGGQRQRVAIGRAIVRKPRLFLLDEPLSNLDAALRVTMRAELNALHDRLGVTMIYVTHDQVEAMTLADRVVVLDKGRVSQFGPPLELFHRPANLFVAGFIGTPKMNLLPGRVAGVSGETVSVTVGPLAMDVTLAAPARVAAGETVTVGVRPDRLRLARGGAGLPARITLVERLGTEAHVHLVLEDGAALTAITEGAAPWMARQDVTVGADPADVHLFDASGAALPRRLDGATETLLAQGSRGFAEPRQQEEHA